MGYEFYLGLDASGDEGLALSLVEKRAADTDEPAVYQVHRLEQLQGVGEEDGLPLEKLTARIQGLIADAPYTGRTITVISKGSGRGDAVAEAIAESGMSPIVITLTGGDAAGQEGSGLRMSGGDSAGSDEGALTVSEHVMVAEVETIYRDGRLRTDQVKSEEASLLSQGLQAYHENAQEAGEALNHLRAEAQREAPHASLVLSTASAVWLGEQHSFDPTEHLKGDPPPMGEAKREMRPDTT